MYDVQQSVCNLNLSNEEINMLGQKFRELRKAQRKSIKEMAGGITSYSSLRRWENGEGEMPINKVMQLLDKLHIQTGELLSNSANLDIYTIGVEEAVKNNDVETLARLAHKLLDLHYEAVDSSRVFFQAAIACNFYMDFTNTNLMQKTDLLRLRAHFLNIEDWTQENVLLFANTQLLLSAEDIYQIARSLFSFLVGKENSSDKDFYRLSVNALVNAIPCLIKKRDFRNAKFILKQVKILKLSPRYLYERLRVNYFEILLNYLDTKNANEMNRFLSGLDTVGLHDIRKEFDLGFSQFKRMSNNTNK